VKYDVGKLPWDIISADFDGDGDADLAVTNGLSNKVSVLLNKGGGVFRQARNYEVGLQSADITSSDFNCDVKLDLAVAIRSVRPSDPLKVSVLLGKGGGGFASPVRYPVRGQGNIPSGITSAELNGDGKLDVAVANLNFGNVSVLLGKGKGVFGRAEPFGVDGEPSRIINADFNDDDKPDLAAAKLGPDEVSVLINTTSSSP